MLRTRKIVCKKNSFKFRILTGPGEQNQIKSVCVQKKTPEKIHHKCIPSKVLPQDRTCPDARYRMQMCIF